MEEPTIVLTLDDSSPTLENTINLIQQSLTTMKTQITTFQQQLKLLEKTLKVDSKKKKVKEQTPVEVVTQTLKTQAVQQTPQAQAVVQQTQVVATKKAAPKKTQKKITGFCSTTELLTDELCIFMKLDLKSRSDRVTVTNYILNYIRTSNLQDAAESKNINADNNLKQLFKLRPEDHLTYFNIQKYIGNLFITAV
jgi:hypothetical protein